MAYVKGEYLKITPVVVPLTRPTTMWGVPRGAFLVEILAVCTAFVITQRFSIYLLLLIIHPLLYMLTIRDPYFVEIARVKLMRTWYVPNNMFWGANSYSTDSELPPHGRAKKR